jgi:hypothetical protein
MTGAFLRVKRDGKFENVEVERLTDEERESKLANDPRLIAWLNLVCRELVQAEELFKELERDGVLQRRPSA